MDNGEGKGIQRGGLALLYGICKAINYVYHARI